MHRTARPPACLQLRRIAAYVGKELSPEAFERVVAASTFDHMRAAPFSNHQTMAGFEGFFRKGAPGRCCRRRPCRRALLAPPLPLL